jgi:hypothetical protein
MERDGTGQKSRCTVHKVMITFKKHFICMIQVNARICTSGETGPISNPILKGFLRFAMKFALGIQSVYSSSSGKKSSFSRDSRIFPICAWHKKISMATKTAMIAAKLERRQTDSKLKSIQFVSRGS